MPRPYSTLIWSPHNPRGPGPKPRRGKRVRESRGHRGTGAGSPLSSGHSGAGSRFAQQTKDTRTMCKKATCSSPTSSDPLRGPPSPQVNQVNTDLFHKVAISKAKRICSPLRRRGKRTRGDLIIVSSRRKQIFCRSPKHKNPPPAQSAEQGKGAQPLLRTPNCRPRKREQPSRPHKQPQSPCRQCRS